jgi:hypothetical protein
MTSAKWDELRKPFLPENIGKRPQVTCSACTAATKNARSAYDKHCNDHQVAKCRVCSAFITTGHMHLDYVGHAVTTSRLLSVDPEWTWEPMGIDQHGLPALDHDGNLWIWLTILGNRKPGVGDGPNAKEKIGDAIRNAAMRFGVALDLWAKEELEVPPGDAEPNPKPEPPIDLKAVIWAESKKRDPALDDEQRKAWIRGELTALGGDSDQHMRDLLRAWSS